MMEEMAKGRGQEDAKSEEADNEEARLGLMSEEEGATWQGEEEEEEEEKRRRRRIRRRMEG